MASSGEGPQLLRARRIQLTATRPYISLIMNRPTMPAARWKLWSFRLILVTIVLGVLQLGAYAYLRAFRGYDGHHLMQYEYDPYKNVLPTRNFVDTRGIRHNSVGFRRSTEVAREKPTGTFRVFLMGGSTAYGLGGLWTHIQRDYAVIRNEDTIDAILERRLASAFPGKRIEVINAAITSTWTHQSLIYLYQSVLNYQPDMVLFLDGFNDFYFTDSGHDQFASYPYVRSSMVIEGEPTLYALATMNGWWAFRKFALVHVMGRVAREVKLLLSRRGERSPMDSQREFAGLQQVFPRSAGKVHERIGVLLQHEAVQAVFMLQPQLLLERDRTTMTPIERRLFEFDAQSYRPNYERFVQLATPWLAEQERQMAQRVGATFIDLTSAFKNVPGQVYTDYCHLTPHGNDVVAGIIAQRIAPLIQEQLTKKTIRAEHARPAMARVTTK
jgi:lysophospholipase L1-like esterase